MSVATSGPLSTSRIDAGGHTPLQIVLAHDEPQCDAVYPARPTALARMRHDVIDAAARCGAPDATLTQIGLAVSEAASNVVLHAYRDGCGGGDVRVRVERVERFLDVSVRDSGIGMSVRTDSPGAGFGLSLMAHATTRCGITSRPGRGTTVLLRFALDG